MRRTSVPLTAVILVGGEGTRLRPLTYYTPKPMLPVLNRPFLEHTVAYLKKYGVESIILALSYLPEAIQDYFGDGSRLGIQLAYRLENRPLGTAGAVKNAEKYLDSTFVVLNGDIFTELDIASMLDFHRQKKAKATIALTWVDNPGAFGVVETDSDGCVRRFVEKPSPGQVTTNWINAGIYILEPDILQHVPAGRHYMFEKGLFPLLLERGEPVYGYPVSGYWLDMGTPQKYLQLNGDLLMSKARSALIGSLGLHDIHIEEGVVIHPTAKLVGPVIIGSRCRIDQKAHISGPVVIGRNCHIAEEAIIDGAVLWSGVTIGGGAYLKQCIISSNIRIKDHDQVITGVVTPDYARIENSGQL